MHCCMVDKVTMEQAEFEAAIAEPTADGRTYEKVEEVSDLLSAKNCRVRVKRKDNTKFMAGGILNHVDRELRYLYVRSVATHKCFCLQIPEHDFWILPKGTATKRKRDDSWSLLLADAKRRQ